MTTTLPRWRFVPLASTLLICSGLFMLSESTSPPVVRSLDPHVCDGGVPGPHSFSSAITQEDPASPGDDDDDDAPSGSDAATVSGDRVASSLDATSRVVEMDADPRPFSGLETPLLRGPPAGRPDPNDVDDADDDDKDDDDDDSGRNEDRAVSPAADSRNPRVLARTEFLRATFFTSEQSLRAPPQ